MLGLKYCKVTCPKYDGKIAKNSQNAKVVYQEESPCFTVPQNETVLQHVDDHHIPILSGSNAVLSNIDNLNINIPTQNREQQLEELNRLGLCETKPKTLTKWFHIIMNKSTQEKLKVLIKNQEKIAKEEAEAIAKGINFFKDVNEIMEELPTNSVFHPRRDAELEMKLNPGDTNMLFVALQDSAQIAHKINNQGFKNLRLSRCLITKDSSDYKKKTPEHLSEITFKKNIRENLDEGTIEENLGKA